VKKTNRYFLIIILFTLIQQTKADLTDVDTVMDATPTDISMTTTAPIATEESKVSHKQKRTYKIRVLLDEQNSENKNSFLIKSDKGIIVRPVPTTTPPIFLQDKTLKITCKNNNLYLTSNDQRYMTQKKELIIKPVSNRFSFNKKTFKGELRLKIDENQKSLYIINNIDLEDYLYSVLRYESYPSWPKDMQKIQAIASRSYAIHCMKQARNKKNKEPFDIKRSNFHQTYNGTHESKHLKEAVIETKGIILTHDNEPILAMFDACCGGIITANMKNPDFQKAPYLARQERCIFCRHYSLYKWKKEFNVETFMDKLKNNEKLEQKLNALGKIQDIRITERDFAGIVHKIKLIGNKKSVILSGQDLWENLKEHIKSLSFNIKKTNNKIEINGYGFGHQIGLCQRGARELLRKGWHFKNILRFYYPKTKFARLKKF